ncbi:tetratricopeptide repeat protein [bacterium]|nr:tetratricopeptide repeat protein [bacterium]
MIAVIKGSEELLYYKRLIEGDLKMARALDKYEVASLISETDDVLRTYNPYTDKLEISTRGIKLRSTEKIWNDILKGEQKKEKVIKKKQQAQKKVVERKKEKVRQEKKKKQAEQARRRTPEGKFLSLLKKGQFSISWFRQIKGKTFHVNYESLSNDSKNLQREIYLVAFIKPYTIIGVNFMCTRNMVARTKEDKIMDNKNNIYRVKKMYDLRGRNIKIKNNLRLKGHTLKRVMYILPYIAPSRFDNSVYLVGKEERFFGRLKLSEHPYEVIGGFRSNLGDAPKRFYELLRKGTFAEDWYKQINHTRYKVENTIVQTHPAYYRAILDVVFVPHKCVVFEILVNSYGGSSKGLIQDSLTDLVIEDNRGIKYRPWQVFCKRSNRRVARLYAKMSSYKTIEELYYVIFSNINPEYLRNGNYYGGGGAQVSFSLPGIPKAHIKKKQAKVKTKPAKPRSKKKGDFHFFNNEGVRLYKAKKYQVALKKFREAEKLRPDSGLLQNNICFTLIKLGKIESARAAFDKAWRLGNKNVLIANNIAIALAKKNRHQEAIEYYQKAIKLDTSNGQTHLNIADSYYTLREYQKATHHYELVLAYGKESDQVYDKLMKSYLRLKKISEYRETKKRYKEYRNKQ